VILWIIEATPQERLKVMGQKARSSSSHLSRKRRLGRKRRERKSLILSPTAHALHTAWRQAKVRCGEADDRTT
jgi:hypothetical protein